MQAFAENGSIKRLRVGEAVAEENLRALLVEVYKQAGVTELSAACVGVASAVMPGVREWITAVLEDFKVARSEVVGDEVIALDAAFKGGPGILQIAGTGTNCIGRAPDGGRETRGDGARGWAMRAQDIGSGCMRCGGRSRPTTAKSRRGFWMWVGGIWGTKTIDELVNLGDSTPGPDFAALAPAISRLAEEGDVVALGVLKQAAADLVDSVLLVRQKLRRKHNIAGEVPVAWIGSIVGKAQIVREGFLPASRPQRRRCRCWRTRQTESRARCGAPDGWRKA